MKRTSGFMAYACGVMCAAGLLLGCDETRAPGAVRTAKFGVLYGGQLQERREIPFVLDRARQKIGLRIEFSEPLKESVSVAWELDKPSKGGAVRDTRGRSVRARVTEFGQVKVRSGQQVLDHELQFRPGDPLGLWNVRVTVGDTLEIDRAFLVYDERARARALAPKR